MSFDKYFDSVIIQVINRINEIDDEMDKLVI